MADKTKIDWCDSTINPVIGCSRGCEYCYARKMNARFKYVGDFSVPQFFPKALKKPYRWKKPRIIFVCSMGELFDPNVPDEWRSEVLSMIHYNHQHRFLLLTKQPERAGYWFDVWPFNAMLGQSIPRFDFEENFTFLINDDGYGIDSFISFEPLLGPAAEAIRPIDPKWIIIGAQTNPSKQPKRAWVQDILSEADKFGIPVLMKHNLEWPESERRFEFPPELERVRRR